ARTRPRLRDRLGRLLPARRARARGAAARRPPLASLTAYAAGGAGGGALLICISLGASPDQRSQPPTAIRIARISPIHAGQGRASLSSKNLITVKSSTSAASPVLIITALTGSSGRLTPSTWAASQSRRTITKIPVAVPQPCQPVRPALNPPTLTCCQSKN